MADDFEDEEFSDELVYCLQDEIEVNIEKCYKCDYLADEDEYHCRFGEVSLLQIQAEQILKHNLNIAVDNIWKEK